MTDCLRPQDQLRAQLDAMRSRLQATENDLRELKRRHGQFIDGMHDGFAAVDLDGRIVQFNKTFAEMIQYPPDQIPKLTYRDITPERWHRMEGQILKEQVFVRGYSDVYEKEYRRADGSIIAVELRTHLATDAHGTPNGMWAFVRDITAHTEAVGKLAESEARFRALFEHAADGFIVADIHTGDLRMANNAACEMTGYGHEEITGLSIRDIHPIESLSQVTEAFEKYARGELQPARDILILRKDGRLIHVEVNAIPVQVNGVSCVLGAFRDVTEKKRLTERLYASEEQYRTVVEHAGETIATVDANGTFLFMNKIAATRLGGHPEDYVGKGMWDVFPKAIADRQAGSVRKVIETGESMNVVVPTEVQGQQRWYNTTVAPVREANGDIRSALIMGRDITELREAQHKLERYRQQVSQTERLASLGALSATVAHELAQPLTVARISIQDARAQLEATGCSAEIVGTLDDALDGIGDVVTGIERFRGFARQSTRSKPRNVQLADIVDRTVHLLLDEARAKQMLIQTEGLAALPEVSADEKDVEQICFALMVNAIQASDGRKNCQLVVKGRVEGQKVTLQFEDTCGGIPAKNLDRVFEPFFTTKPLGEGTGLGLCIVEGIVSRLRGTVHVETAEGEGSIFSISLPIGGEN